MDIDVQDIIGRYEKELSAMTRRALVAEAERDALLAQTPPPPAEPVEGVIVA